MRGRGNENNDPAFGDEFARGFGDAQSRRMRLQSISDVAGELRRPVAAPDLTAAILARVDEQRPFTTPRLRRMVWMSRLALAASISIAALGIALLHRSAPDLVNWTHQPQPVSTVVQTAKHEASITYQSIRGTLVAMPSLPSMNDWGLAPARGGLASGSPDMQEVGSAYVDGSLVPLPPEHSATYISLAALPGPRESRVVEDAGPVVVSSVPLLPGLSPRPLTVPSVDLPSMYWGSRLSTAPAASGSVPVMFDRGELGRSMQPTRRGGLLPSIHRRGLDDIDTAALGSGGGEFAVPR